MSWIKRNLYFFIASLVALALMGAGGYYLWVKYADEDKVSEEIKGQYVELKRLADLNPHPGEKGGKTDNVKAAQDQDKQLRDYIKKAGPHFKRPPSLPDMPKVGNSDFAKQLPNTIAELTRAAQQASVKLPQDYYFGFEAQRKLMTFDPSSLDKLASNLGEIKALCDVLFNARVNNLDGVRRELVSAHDDTQTGDYLAEKTFATPLAELTPYELTFRCFSAELASALSGLANSPYCFIVRTINVEPAVATAPTGTSPTTSIYAPPPGPAPGTPLSREAMVAAMRGGQPPTGYTPPVQPATPTPAPAGNKPVPYLNENQIRVTLMIEVVKIKPQK